MSRRILIWIVLLSFFCSSLPGAARRADALEPGLTLSAAVLSLQAYGVVDKKPEVELRLIDFISRAEVAKVLGSALKLHDLEASSRGRLAFPDTEGHWANGWIAAARDRGLFLGRDGLFYPTERVTYAEILTALLRLIGRSQEASRDWPWGAITTAVGAGMVPPDMDLGGRWKEPAPRGDVFRLTAMAIGRINLPGSGQTLLQSIHDRTPPVLALTGFPRSAGQPGITVTGQSGDAVSVSVAGQAAEVFADGTFSVQLTLQSGENQIPVIAADGAGNQAESVTQILYQPTAGLEVVPALVETVSGQSFSVAVNRLGSTGRAVPADSVSWSYDTSGLSHDAATGLFTALKPGEYTLRTALDGQSATARVVVAGDPAQLELILGQPTLVQGSLPTAVRIRVLDDQGRLHSAGTYQVQISTVPNNTAALEKSSVSTRGGEAVVYLAPGAATGGFGVQAKISAPREIVSPLMPVVVEPRRFAGVKLTAVPAHVEPGAERAVSVTATAVDQTGAPVSVTEDLIVSLSSTDEGVARLTDGRAVIRAGTASSDFGGQNGAGLSGAGTGTALINGTYEGKEAAPAAVTSARAGAMAGLSLRVVQEVAMSDDLSAAVVDIARVDAAGAVVTGEKTPVVLLTRSSGVGVSLIRDAGGVATFAVRTGAAGRVSLTAGVPGRPGLNSAPVEVAFLQGAPAARPVLRAGAQSVAAGDSTVVYVALENAAGGAIPNPGPPFFFQVTAGGGAALAKTDLVIPTGATRTEEVRLSLPANVKSVSVSGAAVGGKPLSAVQVAVVQPSAPPARPAPPGLSLVATVANGARSPVAGEETRVLIQARDGATVRKGAYAFGLKIKLNGKELTELPSNLRVTVGNYSVKDVDLRTSEGEAEVWVHYTGTGTIDLEPVASDDQDTAYDQWGVEGDGEATTGNAVVPAKVTYVAGPLSQVVAAVEPNLGGALYSRIKAVKGRYATVKVTPADSYGNATGTACVATLTRVAGSPGKGLLIRSGYSNLAQHSFSIPDGGNATFTVAALGEAEETSEWAPTAVCGSTALTINRTIKVESTRNPAPTPEIEFAGGNSSGEGTVSDQDKTLKVRIAHDGSAASAAELLVYDGTTLLGRFGPLYPNNPNAAARTVTLPKELLGSSSSMIDLRVRVNTGAEVSEQSEPWFVNYTP